MIFPFQLTRPSRGATLTHFLCLFHHRDFNSHAPRGARRFFILRKIFCRCISTHTPLAGRDIIQDVSSGILHISTHTPLAGRDSYCLLSLSMSFSFQLTRPSRGATLQIVCRGLRRRKMRTFAPFLMHKIMYIPDYHV